MSLIVNGTVIPEYGNKFLFNNVVINKVYFEKIQNVAFGFDGDNEAYGFGTLNDNNIGGNFISRVLVWNNINRFGFSGDDTAYGFGTLNDNNIGGNFINL